MHIVVQPSSDGENSFKVLEEPELGLAKQLVVGDLICFVDSVSRLSECHPAQTFFTQELEEIILDTKQDALVAVIGEPLI